MSYKLYNIQSNSTFYRVHGIYFLLNRNTKRRKKTRATIYVVYMERNHALSKYSANNSNATWISHKLYISDNRWQPSLLSMEIYDFNVYEKWRFCSTKCKSIIDVAILRLSILNGKLLMFVFFLHPYKNDLHASLEHAVPKSDIHFMGAVASIFGNQIKSSWYYLQVKQYCLKIFLCNFMYEHKSFHDSIFNIILDFPSLFRFAKTISGHYIRGKCYLFLMESQNYYKFYGRSQKHTQWK